MEAPIELLFPLPTTVPADGYEEVTLEIPTGLVVVQVRVTEQLLAPDKIVQEEGDAERVPDMGGGPPLLSEHDASV